MEIFGVHLFWYISVIPFVVLTFAGKMFIEQSFINYGAMMTMLGLSGEKTAKRLLNEEDVDDVEVIRARGSFSDRYEIRSRTIGLSELTYLPNSVCATAVAAVMTGHALQHKQKYFPLFLRAGANFIGKLWARMLLPFLVFGLVLDAAYFFKAGVILYIGGSLFQLITLGVEFDAKRRGLELLERTGCIIPDMEMKDVKSAMTAAAFINEAETAIALTYFPRLILSLGSGRSTRG